MSRLLTTGSRAYKDYAQVVRALGVAISDLSNEITVVHGGCPTGADALVSEFINKVEDSLSSRGIYVKQEIHSAKWLKYGNVAGPIRNKEMVDLGADLALVFPQRGELNKGTLGTLKLIKQANIPFREYWGK